MLARSFSKLQLQRKQLECALEVLSAPTETRTTNAVAKAPASSTNSSQPPTSPIPVPDQPSIVDLSIVPAWTIDGDGATAVELPEQPDQPEQR